MIAEIKVTICESIYENCQFCNDVLLNISSGLNKCVVFTLNGPQIGLLRAKYCKKCEVIYNSDNYVLNNQKYFYNYINDCSTYVVTSCQSVFEIALLQHFDKHLTRNSTTFSGNQLV